MKLPRFLWKLFHVGPRIAYAFGLGPLIGRFVLLLATIGRRSGQVRVTPLVYERRENVYLIASARGMSADWIKNIQGNPAVSVRVGRLDFKAHAEIESDLDLAADYLERQMARNPRFFGPLMRVEGLPPAPTRADFKALAAKRPMVALYPLVPSG